MKKISKVYPERSRRGPVLSKMRQHRAEGFTLIELLTVIAIIGILAGIVVVSTMSARYKGRYTRALGDMENIAAAAEQHLYQNDGQYHGDKGPGAEPEDLVPTYLNTWPTPPCSNWVYDWENWPTYGVVRVTLRNSSVSGTPGSAIYYYCIQPGTAGTCDSTRDEWYRGGSPIQDARQLTCDE